MLGQTAGEAPAKLSEAMSTVVVAEEGGLLSGVMSMAVVAGVKEVMAAGRSM